MKIDLSKKGYPALLEAWQVPVFKHVLSTDDKTTSSKTHKWLLEQEDEELHRSRTSVIFFLQDLVEDGLLTKTEGTGKGGAHEIYQRKLTLDGVLAELNRRCNVLLGSLMEGI